MGLTRGRGEELPKAGEMEESREWISDAVSCDETDSCSGRAAEEKLRAEPVPFCLES